jgi:hypothetical protein
MQVSSKLRSGEWGPGGLAYYFWCPGCEELHSFITQRSDSFRPSGPLWDFDGNMECPTFSPSLIMWCGHYADLRHGRPTDSCWCTYNEKLIAEGKEPSRFKCSICHLFLKSGMLQFLPDSTHHLAGKTIPLPDLPEEHRDGHSRQHPPSD